MPAFQPTAVAHASCGTATHTTPAVHPSKAWLLHQEGIMHGHLMAAAFEAVW